MTKLTHDERIARALAAKADAEAKVKRLQEAQSKRVNTRLNAIAAKTGMLSISDEILIPQLQTLVTRLSASGEEVTR